MNDEEITKGFAEDRFFKIGESFLFAVQIPDDSVGISGSLCSNCNGRVAYCEHVCKHCHMPFIGPFGFPQISTWKKMSSYEKWHNAKEVYFYRSNYGRLSYGNVLHFPLHPRDLKKVDELNQEQFYKYFCEVHFI